MAANRSSATAPSRALQRAAATILHKVSIAHLAIPASPVSGGRSEELTGLYRSADFRIADGTQAGGTTVRQALWYFRNDVIALPRDETRSAGFARGVQGDADLRAWSENRALAAGLDFPPLVWIAAPEVIANGRIEHGASAIGCGGRTMRLELTPKIALNRSYFDMSSAAFMAERNVKARGSTVSDAFVVRTLWPTDFRLRALPPRAGLAPGMPAALALREIIRADDGGARSPFAASTLWARAGLDADLTGRTVVAAVLNGAQGDDDESHGGHLALVTGVVQPDGGIGNWLANNFYALEIESEKGIIAAPVPLDNYLADLNSGQGWYRPSYLLVAVLSNPRAAELIQSAFGRVYNQFYRHQLEYDHPTMNCAGITVDTLRTLGWNIAVRGASHPVLAWAALPVVAVKERSLARGLDTFDYLNEDQTRLFPGAAFEEVFASLLEFARDASAGEREGTLGQMLATDVDALVLLRFPQFPSSRAWGTAPAVTPREVRMRLPRDRTKLKIVPVPPRPLPEALRDRDLAPPPMRNSEVALMVWATLTIFGIPWVAWRLWHRRRVRTLQSAEMLRTS